MYLKLAGNIRTFRKERGLTQEQLAEALDVSTGAVSKWELGLSTPELTVIMELAAFFEMSVDQLLGYRLQDGAREAFLERVKGYIHNKTLPVSYEELERMLLKWPNDFLVVYRCASLYEMRGTESKQRKYHLRAVELYEQACRLIDQNDDEFVSLTSIRCRIAGACHALGEQDKAVDILKKNNPCGVNNARLGEILAQAGRGEEALPYLSYGMLNLVVEQLMLADGFVNTFMRQKRYADAVAAVDWLLTVTEAAFLPGKVNYTHKLLPAYMVVKAHASLLMGQPEEAKEALAQAKDMAGRFDVSPDYSAAAARFTLQEAATAYDDYGQTATEGLERMVYAQEDTALSGLWETVKGQ